MIGCSKTFVGYSGKVILRIGLPVLTDTTFTLQESVLENFFVEVFLATGFPGISLGVF
jgi:hypothetical protein